ncbi:MAG TPA: hypothetical protein PKY73_00300 [Hyphomonas sp.]|nr:hypothetical protein [Hyphomonas sp.]
MNTNTISPNMMSTFDGAYPVFSGPVLPAWAEAASAKGFDIAGRIIDRLHLSLRCCKCGAAHRCRLYTLMSAQPLCPACIEREWRSDAVVAGLQFLQRDLSHRHYAIYRAPCGHDLRRQTGLVKRMASGEVGLRCETCHAATEAAEATSQGWTLIGADPAGNPNYRLYRHNDCGHEQRIARGNMQSGRFSCGGCGKDWPAAPSFLYAMSFVLASGREVVKLGFSKNPESRLGWQLQRDPEMPCELLRKVPVTTGHDAICEEKAMHRLLREKYPEAVLERATWQGQIRVKTEIYDGSLTPVILAMLDALASRQQES